MMRAWLGSLLLLTVAGLALVAGACGNGSETATGAGAGLPTGAGGQGGMLFHTGGSIDAMLVLEPATSTIIVDNGVSTPQQLIAKRADQQVYPTKWWVDYATIADVDASGLVTASGTKGGKITVWAELDGVRGSAEVEVFFKKSSNPATATTDDQNKLRSASTTDSEIVWTYPYNGTVWPTGLLPPEMMWNNGGASDLYYLRFQSTYLDLEVFTTAPPPSRYAIDPADWIAINESGIGSQVNLRVARLVPAAATATIVVDHGWTMASGSLRGTVYYWANNLGRIVRIKPGDSAPEDFLASAGITGCSACHTVSANGHTLVIGGDVGTSTYDLVTDTAALSLGSVGKPVRNWAMPAVSPDGKFVVENNAPLPGPPGGSDGLWDAATGTKLTGTGLDGQLLDMPAFGPAGTKLAYVGHAAPHDLYVYDFDLSLGQASNNTLLVPAGSDPSLSAICFPSVSPTVHNAQNQDQTWIVYHRGTYPGSLDTRTGPGDLYLASADTPGVEIRLGRANGDNYPFAAGTRDLHHNYEPTFAPTSAGGYFWVVFTSRRTYGNRLTAGPAAVKQLWVAAVDQFPQPGQDPSHPAFWVPGQDLATLNMRGFWALDPCVQQGEACVDDSDCCDGETCENGLCGGPKECADIGELCSTDGDCCDPSAECIGGVCQHPPPQ